MIELTFAQVDLGEPGPVFFRRLGEQGFLVVLLVVSNWIVARVLLATQRERIKDLKEEIDFLKRCWPPQEPIARAPVLPVGTLEAGKPD